MVDEHAGADADGGREVTQRHHDQAALEQVIGGARDDRLAALMVDGSRHGEDPCAVAPLRQ